MAWRIYKATDPGAPAATLNVQGQLAAILRACLIDGYGSGDDYKSPQGNWEEPFTESDGVCVFRALTGNRQYYQFSDTTTAGIPFRAYESMSDIDSGTGAWFEYYFGKYATTSNMNWIILANDTTVIFFGVGLNGWAVQGFGEYESLFSANPYNNFVSGVGNQGYGLREDRAAFSDTNKTESEAVAGEGISVHRVPDGSGLGAYCPMISITSRASGPAADAKVFNAINTTKKPLFWPLLIGGYFDSVSAPSGSDYYRKTVICGIFPLVMGADCAFVDFTAAIDLTSEWTDADSGNVYLLLPSGVSANYYSTYHRCPLVIPLAEVS